MITIYQYFNVGIKYFVPKSEQNSDQKVRGATGSMALRIKSWPAAKTVGDLEEAAELINRRVMSWSGTRRSMRSSMPAAPADNLCLKAKKWTVNSLSLAKNTSAHNGSFSARMVESNAGHPSVCISVRSTAFQRSSGCRRREPSSTAATSRIQEKAEKARAYASGPGVLGRHIPALERLAGCAGFCSTGHSRAVATGTVPQVLGPPISKRAWSPRETGHRRWLKLFATEKALLQRGGADVILSTSNSTGSMVDSIQGLRPDRRLVAMGADAEPLSISLMDLIMKRIRVIGSQQNGPEYLYEALDFRSARKS